MANKILIPLQAPVACLLEHPANRRVEVGAIEELWRGYSPVCYKGSTVLCALVAVAQAGGGSSVLNLLCAKDQANENCEHRSGIQQIFWQATKGIPWHVFSSAFSSHPSAPLSWDLSLAKTHDEWLQDLMKLRL